MRGVLLSLAFVSALAVAVPARSASGAERHGTAVGPAGAALSATSAAASMFAQQVPEKKIEITVGERGGRAAWYRSPVWIAIGALAVIVVLMLIVMAVRGGGGTTIVKD